MIVWPRATGQGNGVGAVTDRGAVAVVGFPIVRGRRLEPTPYAATDDSAYWPVAELVPLGLSESSASVTRPLSCMPVESGDDGDEERPA